MVQPTRRVVTGHDASGRAVVLIDGAAPNAKLRRATGLTSTLLWVTDRSPADNFGNADAAAREIGVAPPPRGSIFRVVDFPPAAEFGAVDNAAMLREMGIASGQGVALKSCRSRATTDTIPARRRCTRCASRRSSRAAGRADRRAGTSRSLSARRIRPGARSLFPAG